MRGQFERRLARLESKRGSGQYCAFNDEESEAINAISRKYLEREPTREDIRAKDGFMYRITDEEEIVIVNAVSTAVKRGSALTAL